MAGNDFWQSMVNAAKNKTAEVVEFVKKDINELSSTVNAEVHYYSDVVKREATNLLGNVKGSLNLNRGTIPNQGSNPVRSLIKDLWSPETIHDDVRPMIILDSEPVPMTDVQYKHHLLVTDTKNFTEGFSEDEQQQVDAWYATVDENLHDVDYLGKQLSECPALADMYRRLVPDQVSHSEFWKRYFYRRYFTLDCYSQDDVVNDYIARSERDDSEEIDLFGDDEKPEMLEKATTIRGDELFTVEIESPYEPSSSGTKRNDWDIEFEIERLKETNESSLKDIITAD